MPDKTEKQEGTSLEELFVQLESVIQKMEGEDVSLEDSFQLYHRGMDALKQCSERIDEVEKKMLILPLETRTPLNLF